MQGNGLVGTVTIRAGGSLSAGCTDTHSLLPGGRDGEQWGAWKRSLERSHSAVTGSRLLELQLPGHRTLLSPKTHGGWDWGGAGKSFPCSWHPDKRSPKYPLGWAVSYSKHCCLPPETEIHPSCLGVPTLLGPTQESSQSAGLMQSQPHLSSASRLSSLRLRLHICEMALTSLAGCSGGFKEMNGPAVQ